MKLLMEALMKYIFGLISVMVLLFIALLFMPMIFFGSYLYLKEPELLKKRLKSQEKEAKQRLVMDIIGSVL